MWRLTLEDSFFPEARPEIRATEGSELWGRYCAYAKKCTCLDCAGDAARVHMPEMNGIRRKGTHAWQI